MEPPAMRRIKSLQVLKHDRSTSSTKDHEISKPVRRSHNTKAVGTMKTSKTQMSQAKPYPHPTHDGQIKPLNKSQVWDCESSLYDSFELKSLNHQLDLAIKGASGRTLSMPHLPERYVSELSPPNPSVGKHQIVPRNTGRVSKSLSKIIRAVFGSSKTLDNTAKSPSPFTKVKTSSERKKGSFSVYNGSMSMRVLNTIPEVQENDDGHPKISPDATQVVRRAASVRFTAPTVRDSIL